MSYKVIAVPEFSRELKKLSRKFQSLKTEIAVLFEELSQNPKLGIPLGHDLYKIRLAIASKGKGKSGGGRVITYVQIDDNTVVLLSIYNKGEKDTISEKEIHELLERHMK